VRVRGAAGTGRACVGQAGDARVHGERSVGGDAGCAGGRAAGARPVLSARQGAEFLKGEKERVEKIVVSPSHQRVSESGHRP